jgi:hypothetical protein
MVVPTAVVVMPMAMVVVMAMMTMSTVAVAMMAAAVMPTAATRGRVVGSNERNRSDRDGGNGGENDLTKHRPVSFDSV